MGRGEGEACKNFGRADARNKQGPVRDPVSNLRRNQSIVAAIAVMVMVAAVSRRHDHDPGGVSAILAVMMMVVMVMVLGQLNFFIA